MKMDNVDFIKCLKIETFHDMSVSPNLILNLYQCPLWNSTLLDEISVWRSQSVCSESASDNMANNRCQDTKREGYIVGRLDYEEVDCQCDIYCKAFNDCCEDDDAAAQNSSETINTLNNLTKIPNLDQMMGCASNQIPPWNRTNSFGYFMVTDCPDKTHHLRNHCLSSLPERFLNIYHFTPVELQEIVYKNIFCAMCHGVHNVSGVKLWPVYFKWIDPDNCTTDNIFTEKGPIAFPQLFKFCILRGNGITGPIADGIRDIDRGSTRMGKMCLINDGSKPVLKKAGEEKLNPSKGAEKSPFAQAYHRCKSAIQAGVDAVASGYNFLVAKTLEGFVVVRNMTSICQDCPNSMQSLFTDSTKSTYILQRNAIVF